VGSRWVQVPQLGWEAMVVVVTPQDAGRPTARSERAEVADGACRWAVPIFETTKLPTGKDKIYQFLVYETVSHRPPPLNDSRLTAADFPVSILTRTMPSVQGSSKAALLGEATVNLAEYADAFKPSAVTFPLKGSPGALLHVSISVSLLLLRPP
jgi:hypothetical protein